MSRATAPPSLSDLPRWGTVDEYFELDERSPVPLEFFGDRSRPGWGEIVVRGAGSGPIAMAGGTDEHSIITVNVSSELRTRLRGRPCVVFSPDKRVGTAQDPTYAYPDVSVICGPVQNAPGRTGSPVAINPVLIVEVLSASTERDDRERKFARYFEAESLQEYVLVAQDRPRAESYFRETDGGWAFSYAAGLEATLRLRSLGVDLPLAEVYLNLAFPPDPGRATRPVDGGNAEASG